MRNVNESQIDDISLIDLIHIIKSKLWLVVLIWIIVVLIAVIYVLFTKPMYHSSAKVYIGEYPFLSYTYDVANRYDSSNRIDYKKIESPFLVAQKYDGRHGVNVSWDKSQPNIIVFEAESTDPLQAYNELQNILKELLQEHTEKYNKVADRLKQQKTSLEASISSINSQVVNLNKELHNKNKNTTLMALVFIERSKLLESRIHAESLLTEIVKSRALLTPTSVLVSPVKANNPVKPDVKLLISVAVIVGLLVGMIFVFFMEFVINTKRQLGTDN